MTQASAVATNRVLAIDPSLRSTGYAILERTGPGKLRALTYGIIKNPANMLQSGCLVAIRGRVADLVAEYQPDCAAFEAIIYVQSFRTAIVMGCARGAALLAAAEKGLPIYEYAPRRVKQAIVGRGGADKDQVGFMVRALLGLTENPPSDAADALAIGMTHFQASDTIRAGVGQLERI